MGPPVIEEICNGTGWVDRQSGSYLSRARGVEQARRGPIGLQACKQTIVSVKISADAIGQRRLRGAFDPYAVAVTIEIETALHRQFCFRKGERFAPGRGIANRHHGQSCTSRASTPPRRGCRRVWCQAKSGLAENARDQTSRLRRRDAISGVPRQHEQPLRRRVDVYIVFGRHPCELYLMWIIAVKAAEKAPGARGRLRNYPIHQPLGIGKISHLLRCLMHREQSQSRPRNIAG